MQLPRTESDWSPVRSPGAVMGDRKMEKIEKPSSRELFDEDGFKSVQRESDDGWRHGCNISEVFLRESDGTYWLACYRLSTDGETNELATGEAEVYQVAPAKKVAISYETIE